MTATPIPPPRRPLLARILVPLLAFAAGALLVHLFERGAPPPVTPTGVLAPTASEAPGAQVPPASSPGGPEHASSAAEAESTAIPVVTVDGTKITLRELEDALLKKEGSEQVEDAVHHLLDLTNWSKLRDDDLIVATAFGKVKRREVALHLLAEKSGPVREELINIALVDQALSHEGVVIDDAVKQGELGRMEKRLHEGLEKRKQPIMDMRTFIQQTEKTTLENFVRQPGFRMLAGLHILVQRQARKEVKEPELQAYFDSHVEHYRVAEAVDIADIAIPYITGRLPDGAEVITATEKANRLQVANNLYSMIQRGELSFEKTFANFAKNFDQDADAGGRVGWVTRDGERGKRGARRIPARVVEEAFAAQGPFPALLPPVVHDGGVDIVRVHGRRAGQEAALGLMRERVLTDLVDAEIDPRTKRLLDGLRRASTIVYASLPTIIKERSQGGAGGEGGGVPPTPAGPSGAPSGAPAGGQTGAGK